MQVVLGSRGDYAIRAVLYLTRHPGLQRRRDISAGMDIPDKYLPQILGAMVHAGVARSVVARNGGYALARPPESISLREVIEIAEGPIASRSCSLRGGPCYWDDVCALHETWSTAQAALIRALDRTTFADLARRDSEIEAASVVDPDGPRHPYRPRAHVNPPGERSRGAT